MAEQCVRELVFRAARQGSLDVLNDVVHRYGPLSKVMVTLTGCNDEGHTPLHVAIANGHDTVVQFLLAKIHECVVSSSAKAIGCRTKNAAARSSPMMCWQAKSWQEMAHCIGLSDQVPVVYIMEHLIGTITPNDLRWLDFVADCVTASSAISRPEKIVALELVGAAFILLHWQHRPDKSGCHRGLRCWNEATNLRNSSAIVAKVAHRSSEIGGAAYGDAVEWKTGEELQQLMPDEASISDSLTDWEAVCLEPLRIQALLVLERVFKQHRHGDANPFHLKCLLDRVDECAARQQYTQVTNIALLILEECTNLNESSSPRCVDIFIQTFVVLFDCLMRPKGTSPIGANADFLLTVKLSATVLTNVSTAASISVVEPKLQKYGVVKKFVKLIAVWLSWLNDEEHQQLEEHLRSFVGHHLPDGLPTALHYAIWVFVSHGVVISLNAVQLVRLLLRLGADPNAFDHNGQTPMHRLAHHWCWMIHVDLHLAVFQSLVDAGGRLDKGTKPQGQTVMTILREQRIQLSPHIVRFDPRLESMMNTVLPFSLSDLCAQVIRHRRVAYRDRLPCSLRSFVRRDYDTQRQSF